MRRAFCRVILLLLMSTVQIPAARADPSAAGLRAYAAHNYVLSAEIFLPLAEQGDARAQTYLGAARACRRIFRWRRTGFILRPRPAFRRPSTSLG